MKIRNDGLPEPMFLAVKNDKYESGKSDYTPSSLISPAYQTKLVKENWDQLEEDASSRIWALLGTSVHYMIESAGELAEHYTCERRFYGDVETDYGTKKIGAQVDVLDTQENTIYDFKCTSAYQYGKDPKEEWVQQLNVGRWCIWKETGRIVDKLVIVGIWRDWSKTRAKQAYGGSYPESQCTQIELPIWSFEETEKWILDRVHTIEHALVSDIKDVTPCSKKERWCADTKYAVMIPGLKRANKVVDNPEEAAKICNSLAARKAFIQKREGESIRCESYCPVSHLCPFHNKTK